MPQTKEEIKKKQKEWRQADRKENGQSYVRIDTTPATKTEWQAYAKHKGLPLATLIRQCLAEAMAKDNWTYDPENEE